MCQLLCGPILAIYGNFSEGENRTTHVKMSQLVARLQTSRQQVVSARLVTTFLILSVLVIV